MAELQWIRSETRGNVVLVRFAVEKILDEGNMREIMLEILGIMTPGIKLIISFEGVTYMSSVFLGKLIRVKQGINAASGRLSLCSIITEIIYVFEHTGVNRQFKIFDTEDAALQGF